MEIILYFKKLFGKSAHNNKNKVLKLNYKPDGSVQSEVPTQDVKKYLDSKKKIIHKVFDKDKKQVINE